MINLLIRIIYWYCVILFWIVVGTLWLIYIGVVAGINFYRSVRAGYLEAKAEAEAKEREQHE